MNYQAVLKLVLAWLLEHAPEVLDRIQGELGDVATILESEGGAAAAKLAVLRAKRAAAKG